MFYDLLQCELESDDFCRTPYYDSIWGISLFTNELVTYDNSAL